MPQITDIAGVSIDVGDTVVYGVKSEHATLQIGEVVALVPFESTRSIINPNFDNSRPPTYERWQNNPPNDNPQWIRETFTDYKVKVKKPDVEYKDEFGDPQVQVGAAKTLPNPKRFAVIKKGTP
jgi:hypothetical protein